MRGNFPLPPLSRFPMTPALHKWQREKTILQEHDRATWRGADPAGSAENLYRWKHGKGTQWMERRKERRKWNGVQDQETCTRFRRTAPFRMGSGTFLERPRQLQIGVKKACSAAFAFPFFFELNSMLRKDFDCDMQLHRTGRQRHSD